MSDLYLGLYLGIGIAFVCWILVPALIGVAFYWVFVR